jgi:hypothetical protein
VNQRAAVSSGAVAPAKARLARRRENNWIGARPCLMNYGLRTGST